MNARYYNGEAGRFMGVDPVFWEVGDKNFANKWNNNWWNVNFGKPNNGGALYGANDKDDKNALSSYLSNPQHLNSYSYVTNNPLKYTDPTGEWEVHFSPIIPGINIGLGGEFGNSWDFGFASDGTFGLSTSLHGGGLAGADASINWTVGYSNANTWGDTLGSGEYIQAGGKIVAGGGITTNYSDGKYTGTDINIGLGMRGVPDVPVAFSGGINKTSPVFQSSVRDVMNGAKSGYNVVKNTVSNGVNTVKQGASRLSKYIKSKDPSAG